MNRVADVKESLREVPLSSEQPRPQRRMKRKPLLERDTAVAALKQAFIMLRPDTQWKNPVMFVVEVGAFLTLLYIVEAALGREASEVPLSYFIWVDAWLFLTVLFANFATALAEARGKAQAESLRKTRRDTTAYRLNAAGTIEEVSSTALKVGDRVAVQAGQTIPGDGEIVEGIASVDESAITGESAPVIREAGGDRSGVTGGTVVLSDRIVVEITSGAGESFLDRMIALVEGAIPSANSQRDRSHVGALGLHSGFPDCGHSPLGHGVECRAIHDELPWHSGTGQEPRHRCPDPYRSAGVPHSHPPSALCLPQSE